MNRKILIAILLLMGSFIGYSQSSEQLEHLDKYYQQAFQEWNIPGMAIAIVKDNKIIFEKGFGFADLEKKQKVDENTLFAIASNSKAFTSTAIAILVEEGKLNWDDKVVHHLPYFKMYDPYVSREMNIEDLLCHRSGLKTFSGDLLWFGTDKSAEDVVRAAGHLKATGDFRVDYGYSNIMYVAAGLIIEKISGKSWGAFVQERILDPLEMNRTIYSTDELSNTENVAQPYYFESDQNIKLDWLNWDNVVAAGGLISSVHDMSKWLQLNIQEGEYENARIISGNSFEKLSTPHINFSISANSKKRQPSVHFKAYGLGWSIKDQYGKKIISHGGGYDGMISKSWIVPEEKLGMIILTNNLNYLPSALMEKTIDVLIGNKLDGLDYASVYLKSSVRNNEQMISLMNSVENERGKINQGHLPLAEYAGRYRDKMYGDITIGLIDGKLAFQMEPTSIFKADLHHWNDHVFTFRFPAQLSSLPAGKLWFDLSEKAVPERVHIEIENPDFDFMEFEFIRVK